MKPKLHKWKRKVLLCAGSALLLVAIGFAAAHETRQLGAGEKATVTGAILSRDGDLIWVLDKVQRDCCSQHQRQLPRLSASNTTLCFFAIPAWTSLSWSQGVLGLGFSTRPVSVAESWQVEARHSDANLITDATTDYGTT